MGALLFCPLVKAAAEIESDTLKTSLGDLHMVFIGHGTLMFSLGNTVIHIDPVGSYADYSKLPKADLILITHEHGDHLDTQAIQILRKSDTKIVLTEKCRAQVSDSQVLRNGEDSTVGSVHIQAVPAYNIQHMRSPGAPFHPKGTGNGYVLTIGGKRIYIAGDTENTPEMKSLQDIDVAFLPMNLPYTMDPEMVADAAKAFKPKVLYPYHYGQTDPQKLVALLKDFPEIEVRIRNLQ